MPARPAYPTIPPVDSQGNIPSGFPYPDHGMTLREYMAGQALIAIGAWLPQQLDNPTGPEALIAIKRRAQWAVLMANAMVLALTEFPDP